MVEEHDGERGALLLAVHLQGEVRSGAVQLERGRLPGAVEGHGHLALAVREYEAQGGTLRVAGHGGKQGSK